MITTFKNGNCSTKNKPTVSVLAPTVNRFKAGAVVAAAAAARRFFPLVTVSFFNKLE